MHIRVIPLLLLAWLPLSATPRQAPPPSDTPLAVGLSIGTTYYVDVEGGDDANPGTDPAAAWKSLARVDEAQPRLQPGDRVLFRRGQRFPGPLRVRRSGVVEAPITYGAYGEGQKPELTGFETPSNWTPAGEGVWETACRPGSSPLNLVTIDGTARAMGRFPNAGDPDGGYLKVTAHAGRGSITCPTLGADPDWTGGEAVIRKYRWVLDRDKILRHSGGTLALAPASSYEPVNGHGFFIQNHPRTLDTFGEWYFDPAKRTLRVYFGPAGPARHAVRVSAVDVLVEARDRQDLVFEGLRLTGANRAAMRLDGSTRVAIRDCEIRGSGVNAVEGNHVAGIKMEDVLIEDTQNNAIAFPSSVNASAFRRLTIRNTGMTAGMGGSGDGTYNAMTLMGGDDVQIEAFRITDTGYIPVHFSGRRILVRGGFIEGFCSVKDDGGGIYTFKGTADRTESTERRIVGNVVLRSRGAPAGAEGATKGFGIYLDDMASHVEVRGNTVAGTDGGIFLHNARACQVTGNTFFDNGVQALFIHDDIAPGFGRAVVFQPEEGRIAFGRLGLVQRDVVQPEGAVALVEGPLDGR
ncbi:MAG TPA: right-handed parallel beta-helix repeat-containing protein, partial [Planctomycetota bacterium]|nr:right-handed parallel beta-helix repeat-containing protein [Planctomycetota bacterium]